jgi:soluble lytic murein transglycosylase
MAEDAISSANARGLMQVLPGTAAKLAQRHSYDYRGSEQLMKADDNILFGTTFLRELMDRFDDNPVLVSGAYNAGPKAVERWLDSMGGRETAVWIETLPYYETRDYIPRVLAFSTIYDWRLQKPVKRISTRMPPLDSGTINNQARKSAIVDVACPVPSVTMLPGS